MDVSHARPQAAATPEPARPVSHGIVFHEDCPRVGGPCRPGLALLARLRLAVDATRPAEEFAISGTVRLDGCPEDCTLGWRMTRDAGWAFGDVGAAPDIDDLVQQAQARQAAEEAGRPPPAAPRGATIVCGPRAGQ